MKKTTLYVNFEKSLLVMNQAFADKARNVRSEEYKLLQETRHDYPTYAVVKRRIKRNSQKETYAGLTYDYMRMYIATHESKETVKSVMDHFDELLLISQCHCKARRYPVIKSWFLDKYPQIEDFGKPKAQEESSATENESAFEVVMQPLVEVCEKAEQAAA
jgi:hypothetical protein